MCSVWLKGNKVKVCLFIWKLGGKRTEPNKTKQNETKWKNQQTICIDTCKTSRNVQSKCILLLMATVFVFVFFFSISRIIWKCFFIYFWDTDVTFCVEVCENASQWVGINLVSHKKFGFG